MPIYVDVLVLLNFLVDFLLLVGTNRLAGHPLGLKRALLAAALGGMYGGICVIPGLTFLGALWWRILSLVGMAGIAFGFRKRAIPRGILFVLLSMALGGVAVALGRGGFLSLILSAALIAGMCILGFRGKIGKEYVDVELDGVRLTALRDTGNTLTDPITGQQVLVVSSQFGKQLLGLTQSMLSDPVSAMGAVSGARLIPFSAVGRTGSLMLAKKYENVRIGTWKGSCLVAFAPNELGYEALTGGVL